MTDVPIDTGGARDAAERVSIPILVGVVGKRKDRLARLGVSEDSVRQKLRAAFDLLEALTPHSPKLLLCGMADGVDEIAARLVIGTGAQRQYANWSVVGLLPLPEQAFAEDFAPDHGRPWWYHTLDESQCRLVRMIRLQTLSKPNVSSPAGSPPTSYTVEELRRIPGQTNPVRTAHYEQLAFLLAERSTVFIAVMPEDEVPDRLGGTAQAVAHRLNGWREDWPPANSVAVADASREFVVPPPLAKAEAGDVWLIPIGSKGRQEEAAFDFRILRRREETQSAWPGPAEGTHRGGVHVGRAIGRALMPGGPAAKFMRSVSHTGGGRVARAIDAFNRRIGAVGSRKPPQWDKSIAENPREPVKWSPIAAAERIRGTLSDVQVDGKKRVRDAAILLGLFAWLSIVCLELDLEFNGYVGVALPLLYAAFVLLIILVLHNVRWHAWDTVAEDYRMVAEALRVQVVWWQFGLIARRDWVDQHILRYDAREFQLIRQTVASVLESLRLQCAPLPAVTLAERLPEGVDHWIGKTEPNLSGQLGYQNRTARSRKAVYEQLESFVWIFFGIAFAMAIWLAIHAAHEAAKMQLFEKLAGLVGWAMAVGCFIVGFGLLVVVASERFESASQNTIIRRIWHSVWPGLFLVAALLMAYYASGENHYDHDGHNRLHQALGIGATLFLAAAGMIKYMAEKIDVEAEAQNAAEASIIYARARRSLDQIGREFDAKAIDLAEANRQRERIIRDLGLYALAETEAWLRSHRERPLHPPIG